MMKAVRAALHDGAGMLVFSIGLWLSLSARGAVSFSDSPAATSNLYAGSITLQITGLTNGETVLVEKYLDANTNRVVDSRKYLRSDADHVTPTTPTRWPEVDRTTCFD